MTVVKSNIGIKDIALPVTDEELVERFASSALKEFSVRSPRMEIFYLSDENRVEPSVLTRGRQVIYKIPRHVYLDSTIIGVSKVDIMQPLGYSDLYVPQGMWADPASLISAIADVKLAAAVAGGMGKAPTFRFVPPDKIWLYNGWSSGIYYSEVLLTHDLSLSTVSPTAFTHLLQLAELDISEYLYNKLKRIDNLDVGVGNIQLKIDNWEGAGERKRDLLKEWEEGSIDIDTITYF
jgi:hypothetical protein